MGTEQGPATPAGGDHFDQVIVEITAVEAAAGTLRAVTVPPGSHSITVQLPPGVQHGSLIRLPGAGQPDPAGGPPHDLVLDIRVLPVGGQPVPPGGYPAMPVPGSGIPSGPVPPAPPPSFGSPYQFPEPPLPATGTAPPATTPGADPVPGPGPTPGTEPTPGPDPAVGTGPASGADPTVLASTTPASGQPDPSAPPASAPPASAPPFSAPPASAPPAPAFGTPYPPAPPQPGAPYAQPGAPYAPPGAPYAQPGPTGVVPPMPPVSGPPVGMAGYPSGGMPGHPGGQYPPGAPYPPAGYPPAGYPPAGYTPGGYPAADYPPGMPPPAKKRRGKVIAGIGGALALVLLVSCCGGAWLLSDDGDKDASPSGHGASASPTAQPVPPEQYQAALTGFDTKLADALRRLSTATTPDKAKDAASVVASTAETASTDLSAVTPPAPVASAHTALLAALEELASAADDTETAADDRQVCTGSSATALLSRAEALDSLRAAAQQLATADPSHPYTVGGGLPKETKDTNRRAKNGSFIKRTGGGSGHLKIDNGGPADSVISVVKKGQKKPVITVYMRGKSKYTVTGVRDGSYLIYITSGADWDSRGKRFTRNCGFSKFDDTFKFSTTSTQYTIWEITLKPTLGGNASSSGVDPDDFPN